MNVKQVFQKLFFVVLITISIFTVKLDAQADSYRYWDGNSWSKVSDLDYTSNPIEVTYKVKYCYEEAYKMIDLVNAERRKAGVPELVAKDELMDVAMKRAAETALYWSHTRPDGSSCLSASFLIDGENISVGENTAKAANEGLVDSSGHYATMIDKRFSYAGYGYVEIYEGSMRVGSFWVQNFSVANKYYEDGFDLYHPENNKPVEWDKMSIGKRNDYTADFTAKVNPQILSLEVEKDYDYDVGICVGNEKELNVKTHTTEPVYGISCYCRLSDAQYGIKVLTPKICSYQNGKIKALKAGKAKLLVSLKADSSINTTVEFSIKDKPVRKGSTYTVSDNTYKVTSTGKKTVEFKKADGLKKSVSIPKTVKIKGKTYKVTSIAANAFKNDKKIKSVTIPANITKIGKNAFYGCKNLKKITVKTTKLSSKKVGKNVFKGIHKKAVIKVPAKKLGTYKKLFKAKGVGKRVKVRK